MTQKYESVLSDADIKRIALENGFSLKEGNDLRQYVYDFAHALMSAQMDVIQPQLEAIGAGGVSGKPLMRNERDNLHNIIEKELLDIEMCFESFPDNKAAVDALIDWHVNAPKNGYKLVPIEPTNKQVCLIACEIIGYDETGTCRTDTTLWPEYVRKAESAYKSMIASAPETTNIGITSTFKYSCTTCNDSGIIGHSDVCPHCKDSWGTHGN